ncbi:MAG: hypothetical protein VXX66_03215, partial [Actinomycetota bacterium]|nr:hypothetical protein [Actinomycetota bacterium]
SRRWITSDDDGGLRRQRRPLRTTTSSSSAADPLVHLPQFRLPREVIQLSSSNNVALPRYLSVHGW